MENKTIPLFNRNNKEWLKNSNSLILGDPPALVDSINRKHPILFNIYKAQKAADWQENEVDLNKSLLDFNTCPANVAKTMIENIAFQWETDSIAANNMLALLAPIITDSDFAHCVTKNTEIERLHALTYSEIVKLGIPNGKNIIETIMNNSFIKDRNDIVSEQLLKFKRYSYNYAIGNIENNQVLYDESFLALVSFYCFEQLQFMSSFANTFAIVDEGWFLGIGKLVQKIMQDEFYYHAATMRYAIKTELYTDRGMECWANKKETINALVNSVLEREYLWNDYLYSVSKPILSKKIANSWSEYIAQDIYDVLLLDKPFTEHNNNPLPLMDKWLDLDLFQNANQEGDNNNYSLNSCLDDVNEEKIYTYY